MIELVKVSHYLKKRTAHHYHCVHNSKYKTANAV